MNGLLHEHGLSLGIDNLPLTLGVLDGSLWLENLLELLPLLRLEVFFLGSWQILLWFGLADGGRLLHLLLRAIFFALRHLVHHFGGLSLGSLQFGGIVLGLLEVILLHSLVFWNILHVFRRNDFILAVLVGSSVFSVVITLFLFDWRRSFDLLDIVFFDLLFGLSLLDGLWWGRFRRSSFLSLGGRCLLSWRFFLFGLFFLLLFNDNLLSFFLLFLLVLRCLFFSF